MSTRATMSSIQFSQRFTGIFLYLALLFYLITTGHGSPLSIETRSKEFDLGLTEPGSSFTEIKSDLTERSASSSNGSFPTSFDTLGNNFTATSCPQFFSDFLHNETYQSCRAVSILLQNSNTFFKDLGSPVILDQVLDMSCSANITACSKFMANLAANLTNSNNCGADYKLGNPTVTQAYAGMLSYEPIAKAACLQDPSTGEFCFTEAATNSTNISGYSLYLLPLGNSLPGGSRPECNQCTQAIMTVFAESAVIKGNPLSQTYIPAAQTVNIGCGPDFVNATVKVGSENPSSGSSKSSGARLSAVPRPLYTIFGLSITTGILFMSMP